MSPKVSIAVVMTVFNRKEKTEKCITSLLNEINELSSLYLDFYITNDGSNDGTDDLLNDFAKKNTKVNFIILDGSGNLYWNKGMHLAYGAALKKDYDYYLWVNNDVKFDQGFLSGLLNDSTSAVINNSIFIMCGSVRYSDREELSYGGAVNHSKVNPYKRTYLMPSGGIQKCDCINGNCVLIPSQTAKKLGNIEERYEHGFGDFDYGYKLIKLGGQPFIASKFVGECDRNSTFRTWKDTSLPMKKRFILKNRPTGQPPYSHKLFMKKWFPKMWFYYWVKPYVGIISSSLIFKIRKNL